MLTGERVHLIPVLLREGDHRLVVRGVRLPQLAGEGVDYFRRVLWPDQNCSGTSPCVARVTGSL